MTNKKENNNLLQLSGYKGMWMIAMFDLPVETAEDRRHATQFRNTLLPRDTTIRNYKCSLIFMNGRGVWRYALLPPGIIHTDNRYD